MDLPWASEVTPRSWWNKVAQSDIFFGYALFMTCGHIWFRWSIIRLVCFLQKHALTLNASVKRSEAYYYVKQALVVFFRISWTKPSKKVRLKVLSFYPYILLISCTLSLFDAFLGRPAKEAICFPHLIVTQFPCFYRKNLLCISMVWFGSNFELQISNLTFNSH